MTPEQIEAHFTGADGTWRFARWERPLVPLVAGVDDATLGAIKGALEAVCALAGHTMAETDPEMGANLMMFFCRDWAELAGLEGLEEMVPGIGATAARLAEEGARQYRLFRLEPGGEIRACFVFVRIDGPMAAVAAEDLALAQAAMTMLLWSDTAFEGTSPLARLPGRAARGAVLRPEIAGLIRAAYDPVLPGAAGPEAARAHALRLHARMPPI